MIQRIRLEDREVGAGAPCFMIAEIGINHNGDLDLARQTIDAAANSGADGVKFQNYVTEDFISDRRLTYEYLSQGKKVVESQYDMFKRYEINLEFLMALKEHCDQHSVIFHSTPTSKQGIDDLVSIGTPLLKNGSDYLTNLPLLKEMGSSGLPTLISTGMSTLSEIDDALQAYRSSGNDSVILLHCVSAYPAPMDQMNLRRIPALASILGCPIGLSDHSDGTTAAVTAVALGACVIEKHFTLDKNLPGPDHHFSSDAEEFSRLVKDVRNVEAAMGTANISVSLGEEKARKSYRLSCVLVSDMPAGKVIELSDIAFRRPGNGLPPKAIDWIVGRRLGRFVAAGDTLEPEDFQ